jgi:Ala-tRNA(Pro) deacylase
MAATPDDLFAKLDELGIETTTHEHAPVFTVEEAQAARGAIPGAHCKCLFFKDKKGELWLVAVLEEGRMDLKDLQARIGAARLSFGKPDLMADVLGVEPGTVTPFAAINDAQGRVQVILQAQMMDNELVNYHPLTNAATTSIRPDDLVAFLRATGHEPRIIAL